MNRKQNTCILAYVSFATHTKKNLVNKLNTLNKIKNEKLNNYYEEMVLKC